MVKRILNVSISHQQLRKLKKLLKKAQEKNGLSTLKFKVESLLPENPKHWRLGHLCDSVKANGTFYAHFPTYDIEIVASGKKNLVRLAYRPRKKDTWTLLIVSFQALAKMSRKLALGRVFESMVKEPMPTGYVPENCFVEARDVDETTAQVFIGWNWNKK